ncbi:MAG: hypothetical protein JWL64_1032, partial [Frankiales bacterium]|nr:hypothetical protein [Frankiales bacterium]
EFVAPDLADRVKRHVGNTDVFAEHRVDEQLLRALDRKVWLPSGGSLVIDRTEAMVVIDVNTGKYVGKGGNLEETVTRNNLEAAEEIARQLRLRDLGGIIVVDFIDMVLESNRDLVVRRLVECLGRDRTKHQVAEVTSLGLVQMTRKRVGQGLLESFSETCEHCNGRGVIVSSTPIDRKPEKPEDDAEPRGRRRRGGSGSNGGGAGVAPAAPTAVKVDPAVAAHAVAVIAKASALLPREAADDSDDVDDAADLPVISRTAFDQGDNGDPDDDELDLGDRPDPLYVTDDVEVTYDPAISRRGPAGPGRGGSTDRTDESDALERAAAYVGPDTGDAAPTRAAEDPDAPARGRGRRRRSSRGTVTAEPVGALPGLATADPVDVSEQQTAVLVEEVAVLAEPQPVPVVADLAAEADIADVVEQTTAANPVDAEEAAVTGVPVPDLPASDPSVPEAAPRRRRRAVSRPAGPTA